MTEKPQLSAQSAAVKRQQTDSEHLLKHRNDAIKSALKGMIPELEGSRLRIDFYCECFDPACAARIGLLLAEYERIHHHPRHFLVRPGHATAEEEIITRHRHYWVVRKD